MRAVPTEPLLGAIARGWCHPANAHKQMDADLANAIADEVNKWLAAAPAPVDGLVKRLRSYANESCGGQLEEDLLAAAAALQSRDEGWMDIETAPKGEPSILWGEKHRRPLIGDWGDYCINNEPMFTKWKPAPTPPRKP